jgi:hypothetical protein
LVTPGSTIARRLSGSISMMARIREVTIRTPSDRGRAPPDRPVPEPRATKGIFACAHAVTIAATWSAVVGSTTRPGEQRCAVSPSHS